MKTINNYHRFYALLNQLHQEGDKEELKATLVHSFTKGRTTHLKEMNQKEYQALCKSLEAQSGYKENLRRLRSICLKLMQEAGIDTGDWQRINDFCLHPRITGKVFAQLNAKELDLLHLKLRSIIRKGGLKDKGAPQVSHSANYIMVSVGKEAEA